jgi:opacity protein-like surface antigen
MFRGLFAPIALGVAALLVSTAALAQDEEEEKLWNENGIYVQLAGTYGIEEFGDDIAGDDSLGLNVRAGLRAARWLSIEAEFEWLSGMDPYGISQTSDWATTFNLRIYPLTNMILNGRIQPYVLMGAGLSSFRSLGDCTVFVPGTGCTAWGESRNYGFASRWGAGVDAYVTEKIAITVGASYLWSAGTPVEDLNYISVSWGVMYRFY